MFRWVSWDPKALNQGAFRNLVSDDAFRGFLIRIRQDDWGFMGLADCLKIKACLHGGNV